MVARRFAGQFGDQRPVDHGRRHHAGPIETEIAFDHAPGCIDAVDINGHAGFAGYHDLRRALRKGRRRSHRKQQPGLDKTHD
jgi:hypothetical protein